MTNDHDTSPPNPFGVHPALLPYMEWLLRDFHALGGAPEVVLDFLAGSGIGPRSRVLDLGAGKGAISLAVAQEFKAHVLGLDLYAPFVEHARDAARDSGLEQLCEFRLADIRTFTPPEPFDAVLCISVGNALGNLQETVAAMRAMTRPGGLMLLDDGYRLDKEILYPGYEQLAALDEALRQITAHGDTVLREYRFTQAFVIEQNRRYQLRIENRAREIAAEHPELARILEDYVEEQRRECRILENKVQCVSWLLHRAPDSA